MEVLKLIQCYHCLEFSHPKNLCPRSSEQQICGRCSDRGHAASTCEATSKCYLCGEQGHPATARCCKVYKETFRLKIIELLKNPPSMPELEKPINETKLISQIDISQMDNLTTAVSAAIQSTNNPTQFTNTLFTILKASSSSGSGPPPMTYSHELDDEVFTDENSTSNPLEENIEEPIWDNEFEEVKQMDHTEENVDLELTQYILPNVRTTFTLTDHGIVNTDQVITTSMVRKRAMYLLLK